MVTKLPISDSERNEYDTKQRATSKAYRREPNKKQENRAVAGKPCHRCKL